MPVLSNYAVGRMQSLSWELTGCCAAELEQHTLAWLQTEFGADYASLSDFTPGAKPLRLEVFPQDAATHNLEQVTLEHLSSLPVSDHPVVVHYFYRNADPTPVRISDLLPLRELKRTRAYSDVLRRVDCNYQMVLLTRRDGPGDGAGFSVARRGRDYDDDALGVAIAIQPVLVALRRAAAAPVCEGAEAAARLRLTAAERDVLRLLAAGLTAAAIARVRRTSTRTVRKHLDHLYAKLGYHDRLLVVAAARNLGLLHPPGERSGHSSAE